MSFGFGDSVPTLSVKYTTRGPILSDRQAARVRSSPGSLRRPSAVIQTRRDDGVGSVLVRDIAFDPATGLRLCPDRIPWVDEPP